MNCAFCGDNWLWWSRMANETTMLNGLVRHYRKTANNNMPMTNTVT